MSDPPNKPAASVVTWILLGLALYVAFVLLQRVDVGPEPVDVPYSGFKTLLEERQVETVVFRGDRISGTFHRTIEVVPGTTSSRFTTRMPPVDDPDLLPLLDEHGVEVVAEEPGGWPAWVVALLPWVLIIGFWYERARWSRSRHRRYASPTSPGQDNAKAEVAELLEFLRDPERYRRLGAEVPHGILLHGPARNRQDAARPRARRRGGVPFFHISASEFIEVFVGVGASRVRKLFEEAKKSAPSIIFIDELDSVGRTRGTGSAAATTSASRRSTRSSPRWTASRATRPSSSSPRPTAPTCSTRPAAPRPLRPARHAFAARPEAARRAILAGPRRKVPLAEDVDLDRIAAGTPGFSGADLKNLVNEAAMAAARRLDRVSAPISTRCATAS
jgi:cell division protease FtsH